MTPIPPPFCYRGHERGHMSGPKSHVIRVMVTGRFRMTEQAFTGSFSAELFPPRSNSLDWLTP